MKKLFYIFLLATLISCQNQEAPKSNFVEVNNLDFVLNQEPYHFSGANYWFGMNLGAEKSGDRTRLISELDQMQKLGITNLRVLAASEAHEGAKFCVHPALQTAPGVFDEDVFGGLDFLLAEMAKRDMKAIMVLSNYWTWSGGFPQFLEWSGADSIPYPQEPPYSWSIFTSYSCEFYKHQEAQQLYYNTVEAIINRKNHITNKIYKNDPTIMTWELANEPRGYDYPAEYRQWLADAAAFIKGLDKNHLVAAGNEGSTNSKDAGVDVILDNQIADIDYITLHVWPQNWSWFDPNQAKESFQPAMDLAKEYIKSHEAAAIKLNKPMVLEEFGIARDGGDFQEHATTVYRDKFYEYFYQVVLDNIKSDGPIQGINFWSYTGEGRAPRPGEFWKKGDTFIGDPPHELQGWYSVYDKDESTLNILRNFNKELQNIKK